MVRGDHHTQAASLGASQKGCRKHHPSVPCEVELPEEGVGLVQEGALVVCCLGAQADLVAWGPSDNY